jgi:predicted RNA binding protein YcfA (HicA-like mRNA interferase family)
VGELAGIPHLKAVRALERAGFRVQRQSKHIIMSNGERTLIIPRNNPLQSFTLVSIVRAAGLTIDPFREWL